MAQKSPTQVTELCSDKMTTPAFSIYYDRCATTRKLSIFGLALAWCLAIACIVVGAVATQYRWSIALCWDPGKDLVILAQVVAITICNESLGYIHAVSLRWNLYQEGRLEFNSNLRLLQTTKAAGPNAWYSNVIVMCGITVTYGASSLTFCPMSDGNCAAYRLLGEAWILLGCGLMAQACIATWAISQQASWPTWSTDMIDTAAACMQLTARSLAPREQRSMHNVSQDADFAAPVQARTRQPSAYASHQQVRHVLWAMLALCLMFVAYDIGLFVALAIQGGRPAISISPMWDPINPYIGMFASVSIPMTDSGEAAYEGYFIAKDFVWIFSLLCVLQLMVTVNLHLAELCVYLSRDETAWRKASKKKGKKRKSSAPIALFTSYQSLILFCVKPCAHWLFGLGYMVDIYNGVSLMPTTNFWLSLIIIALVAFAATLAFWRHRGPQPSTFGHLQTLIDLIDVWPASGDRLYWGDKGIVASDELGGEELRRAGTHWTPLPPVEREAYYV